jgi:hypothetical protein
MQSAPTEKQRRYPFLSFCNFDYFRAFSNTPPVPDSDLHQPLTVLKVPRFCTPTVTTIPAFPFSDLLLRISTRPALLLHGSNNSAQLWTDENASLTAEPPQRTLCGGILLHSMQESPGSNRETIETHTLILSGYEPDMQSHMQHIKDKHTRKQPCKSIISTTHRDQTHPWNLIKTFPIYSMSVHGSSPQALCSVFSCSCMNEK